MGSVENLMLRAPALYGNQPEVTDHEWNDAVRAMELTLTAHDMLDELCDAKAAIDACVSQGKPHLISSIYMACRRAYSRRLAWRELYGTEPKLPSTEETAAAVLLLGDEVAQ